MSESFAAGSVRLCRHAARLLGWRPDDFWRATPEELAAIFSEEGADGGRPLGRREMQILMERDPDGR